MKNNKKIYVVIILIILLVVAVGTFFIIKNIKTNSPEELLKQYVSYINEQKYEEMYDLISEESKNTISKEDYISRNQKIYNGIEMKNMQIVEKIRKRKYRE